MANENWVNVSPTDPCPICGKADWCRITADKTAVVCGRVQQGAVKRCKDGRWLHRRDEEEWRSPPPVQATYNLIGPRSFQPIVDRLTRDNAAACVQLADELGVSASALMRLRTGYHSKGDWWAFPERDAAGKVIGIMRRLRGGQKRRMKGSKNGLTYADDWDTGRGPILLVEGASDTAALMTMGVSVIGRPSNMGGAALLSQLLAKVPAERPVIVLGENDRKPSGLWPGRLGALHTAQRLAPQLKRPIQWALPPDGAKDVRQWLQTYQCKRPQRLRELFLGGLDVETIEPPREIRIEPPRGRMMTLEEYRCEMLERRRAALRTPGIYLDRSPTGSGKSHADLCVLSGA